MDIFLYKMSDERTKVGKHYVPWTTSQIPDGKLSGTLRDETSVIDPEIIIELPEHTIPSFNYAWIPAFSRRYFVNDVKSFRNQLWRVIMHVDVLDSYASQIREQRAVIARNQFDYNDFLIDDRIPATVESVTSAPWIFPKAPFTPGIARNRMVLDGMWANPATGG